MARGGGRGHLRLLTGAGAGGGGRTCFFSPLPVLRSIFSVNGGWTCAHGDQNRQHSEDLPEPPVRQRPWEAAGQRRRPCSSRRRKEEPCRGVRNSGLCVILDRKIPFYWSEAFSFYLGLYVVYILGGIASKMEYVKLI